MKPPRVLSVGQCGFDHRTISSYFSQTFQAQVQPAATGAKALEELRRGEFDLVLVNRVTDADGSPGLNLIRALKADAALAGVPVMLVSNYPDAQRQAVELGALPGFGKSQLHDPETKQRLTELFGGSS